MRDYGGGRSSGGWFPGPPARNTLSHSGSAVFTTDSDKGEKHKIISARNRQDVKPKYFQSSVFQNIPVATKLQKYVIFDTEIFEVRTFISFPTLIFKTDNKLFH